MSVQYQASDNHYLEISMLNSVLSTKMKDRDPSVFVEGMTFCILKIISRLV